MGTAKYLDKVIRILPAVQARQLSEVLADLQVSGQVRDATEYSSKLQKLAALVNSETPTPSFQQIRALVWHLCSSEGHNIMMKAATNDIEAVFLQTDELGQKLSDHHLLFMNNLIADLETNLQEQENNIKRLEWLAGENNEFSRVLVNSFTSSSLLKVPRSEVSAENLYFDNRTYENKTENELSSAKVSERGKKLILDVTNEPVVLPINVKIHTDEYSYGTKYNVDIENDISNLIDKQTGTFWTRNVYTKEKVPKVTTLLEFDFGLAKDVDYLIVEGGSAEPFYIEEIIAVSPDGNKTVLDSTATEIQGKSRIDFGRTLAQSVIVKFVTYTYRKAEYFVPKDNTSHDVTSTEGLYSKLQQKDNLAQLIREALASKKLANICNVPDLSTSRVVAYLYSLVLDNVWFGNSKYQDTGVFVSKPLNINDIGSLAVQVDETSETGIVRNSIEYEIIKVDRTPKYNETKFSIPYLGQNRVYSERLVLTKSYDSSLNDTGTLRFLPYVYDWLGSSPERIYVYKNGEILELGNDWEYAVSSNLLGILDWQVSSTYAEDFNEYTLAPQKFFIKIKNPELGSVYTVNYKIRTSDEFVDSPTVWLDSNKTISLLRDGRIYFRREDSDVTIESDVYLQVTLRRNKASQSTTPELKEYAVLAASYE